MMYSLENFPIVSAIWSTVVIKIQYSSYLTILVLVMKLDGILSVW